MKVGNHCISNYALTYTNFYGDVDVEMKYEEGVISGSMKEFETKAVHIRDEVRTEMRGVDTLEQCRYSSAYFFIFMIHGT